MKVRYIALLWSAGVCVLVFYRYSTPLECPDRLLCVRVGNMGKMS